MAGPNPLLIALLVSATLAVLSAPWALDLPALNVICLAAMAAQAAVVWRVGAPRGAVLACGGALFMTSDALLAGNKFASPLPLANLWILGTYWSAQWCIASWLAPAEREA